MTPIYLNLPSSPFIESNEDQNLQLLSPPSHASSSSSLSFPIFFDPPNQDQGGSHERELKQKYQQEAGKYVCYGGSSDHQFLPTHSLPTVENDRENTLKLTICKQEDRDDNQSDNVSVKWMSSKMRVMKKMMNSDQLDTYKSVKTMQRYQDQQKPSSMLDTDSSGNYSSNNMNNTIRVCADCNTTKTPLWRSGPRGPKSLCNACGIRQRKARRAMAAAAAGNALLTTKTTSIRRKVHHKEKRSDNGYVKQHKKRGRKKLCFEDFTISLSKNSAFHRVFPQDEKEAAILLMALSCGLVHG